MSIEFGLFDIMQIDPLDSRDHGEVYQRKLRDLELAESLGLTYYFTAERHYMQEYHCSSATAWIGAASQRTSRIRLGALGYTLPLHPPVQLAEDIAVLDWLSGGRLEVGLGLGHRTTELEVIGIDPNQRLRIFQERLAIMEALWNGGKVSLDSATNPVHAAVINPIPVQVPRPPLWYAGNNPPAATWAGSNGVSLAIGFKPTAQLKATTDAFHAAVAKRSANGPDLLMPSEGRIAIMRQIYIADSDEEAFDDIYSDLMRLNKSTDTRDRSESEHREQAAKSTEALIRDEMVVAGSPQTVAKTIEKLKTTLGITVFLANPYASSIDDERVQRSISLLAGTTRKLLTS